MGERTNDQWLAALRSDGPPAAEAQAALWRLLRHGLARSLSGRAGADDALLDDLTQEATVKVLTRLDGFRGESRFTTWAVTIAVRVAFSELRKNRWKDVSLERYAGRDGDTGLDPADPRATPEQTAQRQSVLEILHRVLDTELTERQRLALRAELNGVPQVVIAEQLGINRNALYKLGHDARKRLKARLQEAGITADEVRSTFGG